MAADVTWSPEADAALQQQVPEFAQETARANTEEFVRQKGESVVTLALWQEAIARSGRFSGGGPPGAS